MMLRGKCWSIAFAMGMLFSTTWVNAEEAAVPSPYDVDAFLKKVRAPQELPKPTELKRFEVPEFKEPEQVWLSADHSRLAVADWSKRLMVLWDTKTGEQVSDRNLVPERYHFAFSNDGAHFVLARPAKKGENLEIVYGDSSTGKVLKTFRCVEMLRALTFTNDNQFVLQVDGKGQVHRQSVAGDSSSLYKPDFEGTVKAAEFSSSGRHVALHDEEAIHVAKLDETDKMETTAFVKTGERWGLAVSDQNCVFTNRQRIHRMPNTIGRNGTIAWFRLEIPSKDINAVATAGGRIVVSSREGNFQIIDEKSREGCVFQLGTAIKKFSLAGDGLTFAAIHGDNTVALHQFPREYVESTERFARREITQLLHKQDFRALDAIFTQLEQDFQPLPFEENVLSYQYFVNILLDYPADAELEVIHRQSLSAWANACPDSTAVLLLKANRHLQLAWQARGGGYANTVSRDAMEEFSSNIAKAHKYILPLLEKETLPPPTFNVLFDVAKAQSWPEEECRPYIDKLLKTSPRQFDAHIRLSQKLMVRWGGDVDDLKDYAALVADQVGGLDGDALYARIVWNQACFYRPQRIFSDSKLDYGRTIRGCEHLFKTAGDGKQALVMAVWLAKLQEDQSDFERLKALVSDSQISLSWPIQLWQVGILPSMLSRSRSSLVRE